jgi:superfamily II DNA or RNA helicase
MTALRDRLEAASALYEIPNDDLVGEVIIPSMSVAREVMVGAGFFSSMCLAQVAPGLAAFIEHGEMPMRVLASPAISEDDQRALRDATENAEDVAERTMAKLFEDSVLSSAAVQRHAVECLAYLVAAGRLELRVVLMPRGQYHKKFWIFGLDKDAVVVHGSGNATERGLLVNGEQMSVERSWSGEWSAVQRIEKLTAGFEAQWNNSDPNSVTVDVGRALELLKSFAGTAVPTVADFWDAWRRDAEDGQAPALPPGVQDAIPPSRLVIPGDLEWETGNYRHQAQAVAALESSSRRGILSIATGGGKTKTSLVSATRAQDEFPGSTLLCVVVPSSPLVAQWQQDIIDFGVHPRVLSGSNPRQRRGMLEDVISSLASSTRNTEVLLMTTKLLVGDDELRAFLDRAAGIAHMALIADEVHNLGADGFVSSPPNVFEFRLGLSATPVRQYDDEGTEELFNYFGGVVYEFSLRDAIDAECLCEYDYFVLKVELNELEMDEYERISAALVRAGYGSGDDPSGAGDEQLIQTLLRKRRAILEYAKGKMEALEELLDSFGPGGPSRTLIYASAKPNPAGDSRQIDTVNEILRRRSVNFHQFTSEESRTPRAAEILGEFGSGLISVLTAMKVLDEGVDIPQTDAAVILSSSTVEREWVQRRGRVLRRAPGKNRAKIYDFLVVPPDPATLPGKAILRSELKRVESFANDSWNGFLDTGPRQLINELKVFTRVGGE